MNNPKAYLIGGAPRTGKTVMMHRFMREKPMMAISTDAVRYLVRRIDAINDERLFSSHEQDQMSDEARIDQHNNQSDAVIRRQNTESEAVWPYCEKIIASNQEDGLDIFVEGVAVLPKLLSAAEYPHKAIFIGNQSEEFYDSIVKSARENTYDWMHSYSDELIKSYANFFNDLSRYFETECKKFGYQYIEASDQNFDETIKLCVNELKAS